MLIQLKEGRPGSKWLRNGGALYQALVRAGASWREHCIAAQPLSEEVDRTLLEERVWRLALVRIE